MRRILKWVGIVLAVLAIAVISLPFLINVNQFKPMLESELSTALNREVKLGNLKLSLFAGEVTADDLSVAEDQAFGKPAFIRARSLSVGAEIWPFLMSRRLIVTYLTIDQPEIALIQAPSGNWNFSSLGSKTQKSPGGSTRARHGATGPCGEAGEDHQRTLEAGPHAGTLEAFVAGAGEPRAAGFFGRHRVPVHALQPKLRAAAPSSWMARRDP